MAYIFSPEDKTRLLNCNTCYMLGTLAEDEPFYPSGEEEAPVTTMRGSSNIVFYIRAVSTEPEPISQLLPGVVLSELYIGIDAHQLNQSIFSLSYRMTANLEQKKRIIMEKFKNKLILFRPKINFSTKDNRVHKNLEVTSIESDVELMPGTSFAPVPRVNMSNSDFERKLLNGNTILLEEYSHVMHSPRYILCGNHLYYGFPAWKRHNTNNRMWVCEKGMGKILRVKIDTDSSEMKNKYLKASDGIVFIDEEFLEDCQRNKDWENIEQVPFEIVIPEASGTGNITEVIAANEELSEYKFLRAFKQYTVREKLCYEMNDLINFHICVKTNPLTVVAGMSGTGKTQLALSYARMLDLSEEEETLLFLPISPSYTEPGDLLGYLNSTNSLYVPSETGLTDFLIHASRNPDRMHMVIFDEMNLSQVEYWFSPFISLLEKEEDTRVLHLYSSKANCLNHEGYPDSIKIGNNIIFIGTVNMDETTKDFSDRLLDRANIVVLNKKSFVQLKEEQENEKNSVKTYEQYICSSFSTYSTWVKVDDALSAYSPEELEFLDELHNLIQKFDSQKGVSFRIVKKIGDYLRNMPYDEKMRLMLSREDAFDLEIKQRLITKIKGIEKQYENLIGTIRDGSESPAGSMLYDFFNSASAGEISHFKLTKKEIARKARELGVYGYAS